MNKTYTIALESGGDISITATEFIDIFSVKENGVILHEITVNHGSDTDDACLSVKSFNHEAACLPFIHGAIHLATFVYQRLCDIQNETGDEFFACLFYDDKTDSDKELPLYA